MRTQFAILIGAGTLSLMLAAPANAAINYHHRHHASARNHSVPGPTTAPQSSSMSSLGNNPAKAYPTRHASEGAVREGTLTQNGNNPAKRYKTRQLSDQAVREGTLMQSGNNPAKRARSTTGAAQ